MGNDTFQLRCFPEISFTDQLINILYNKYLDMHDAAHTMMISDIATSAWLIDFCHKAI